MKRLNIALFLSLLSITFMFSSAMAGPRVAIVKSDNHELVGEDFSMAFDWIHPYDFDKPIETILASYPKWGAESEAAIEKMVREAIKLAGDWPVKKGNTVFIKPNLVVDVMNRITQQRAKPEQLQATITDPRVVRATAIVALESGARKVVFGDLPAHGDSYATAKHYGYEAVAQELNRKYPGKVELLDLKAMPYKAYKAEKTDGLALKEYAMPEIFVDADILISVPAMKTHTMAGMTGALKNIGIGAAHPNVYGQYKMGIPHQKLAEVITDVCSIAQIDYVVMDAIWAMEGNGPVDGSPVAMDMVIAGKDPVAVDWVATECMGFKGDMIGTTRMGQKYGLGTYQEIEVVGVPILQAMKMFSPVERGARFPSVYSHNVGWGADAVAKD